MKNSMETRREAASAPQSGPNQYPLESMLTIEEVAHHFNISTRTVMRMVDGRQIRAVRIGRQWRFKKEWLDEWLSERTQNVQHRD